jgi:hypothetical protein
LRGEQGSLVWAKQEDYSLKKKKKKKNKNKNKNKNPTTEHLLVIKCDIIVISQP